jgi:hypothetical protein
MPAVDRVIALLADPQRPGGSGRAAHRPALATLVHHATGGAVPLAPECGDPGMQVPPGSPPSVNPGGTSLHIQAVAALCRRAVAGGQAPGKLLGPMP